MQDLEKYREYFQGDLYATKTTGCVIEEVGKNYSRCSLTLEAKHINACGSVMGGVIFTLADFAFAVATNALSSQCVTASSTINYLRRAKGNILFASTRLIKDGKTTCLYEIDVYDNLDNKVALVTSLGMKIRG